MTSQLQREITSFINENRASALWSLAPDFEPRTTEAAHRVLERVPSRGNRTTWIRARQLLRELKVQTDE